MKRKLLMIIMLVLTFSMTPILGQANDSKQGVDTKTEVSFKESKPKKPKEKDNIYKPDPPREKELPQTGEIVTTYIIMLLGIGVLLLFLGVYSLKITFYESSII